MHEVAQDKNPTSFFLRLLKTRLLKDSSEPNKLKERMPLYCCYAALKNEARQDYNHDIDRLVAGFI